jgi:hypothetical protein
MSEPGGIAEYYMAQGLNKVAQLEREIADLRAVLREAGIEVEHTPEGVRWRMREKRGIVGADSGVSP